jgi:hypothetical protein
MLRDLLLFVVPLCGVVLVLVSGALMVYDPRLWVAKSNQVFRLTMGSNIWFQLSDKPYEKASNRTWTRLAGVVTIAMSLLSLVVIIVNMWRLVVG